MTPTIHPLSGYERALLLNLKREVIECGTRAGKALIEIRDKKLYRETGLGFAEFAQKEFGFGKAHTYRLIEFTEIKESPIGDSIKNEGQAREVSKIPPERREEVLNEVHKNGPLTATAIRETASKIIDVPFRPDDEEPPVKRDLTGYPIPDHKVSLFDRSEEVEKVLRMIASVRGTLQTAQDNEDRLWQPVIVSAMMTNLDGIYANLKTAVPYAVCPYCSGITADHCLTCKGRGVISKFTWDTVVPSDLKAVRAKCSVVEK